VAAMAVLSPMEGHVFVVDSSEMRTTGLLVRSLGIPDHGQFRGTGFPLIARSW
jgi:hypothetical protein